MVSTALAGQSGQRRSRAGAPRQRRLLPVTAAAMVAAAAVGAGSADAVSYYVSSSNPAASDGNAGTSPAAPWKTLGRAAAAPLRGGDAVLLRSGDVWLVTAPLALAGLAGSAAAPVTFSAYTDAGAGAERPLVARDTAVNPAGPVVVFNDSAGVVVDGWEVAGGEQGVVLFYHGAGVFDTFAVTDCYFRDIRGTQYNPASGSWWGSAIAIAAAGAGAVVTNVTVSHNLFNASDTAYINAVAWAGTTRAYVAGVAYAANTMSAMSYNTLFMDTTTAFVVSANVFLRDTPDALFVAGTTDIIMGTLNASCALVGNEIAWRGEYAGGPDGCAIDFETQADGVTVAGNYIHNAWGSGIMVLGHATTSTNLVITDNVLLYNGCNQTAADHGAMAFMHVNSSGVIANNLFATCPGTPVFNEVVPGAMDGFTFVNNTIANVSAPLPLAPPPTVTWNATGGVLTVTATCAVPQCSLTYTTDGSRPTAASAPWPPAGTLTLPARATAVNVKAWVPGAIESSVAGGIMAPPPRT